MTNLQLEKITPTDYEVHPLIRDRWSSRSFSDQTISGETVLQLLEAMRWAPSSMNEQPWKVIAAAKGTATYTQLESTLMPGNKSWAAKAPLLILAMARTTFKANGSINRSAQYDLGLAVGNLSLQATSLGLAVHQMGEFDKQLAKALLQIDEHTIPVVLRAVGYRDSPELLPPPLNERETAPRRRKKVAEFAELSLV